MHCQAHSLVLLVLLSLGKERFQDTWEEEIAKDKLVNGGLYVIETLFKTCRVGKKPLAILASAWPTILAWTEHVYEDIYLCASPEIRVGWRQCFTRICDLAVSNIYLTAKSCRIIVKLLWMEAEDQSLPTLFSAIFLALMTCQERRCKAPLLDTPASPSFLENSVAFEVIDIRNSRNRATGSDHIYEVADRSGEAGGEWPADHVCRGSLLTSRSPGPRQVRLRRAVPNSSLLL